MSFSKVWFITGANNGLGLEITKKALAEGDKVIAAVRTPSRFPAEVLTPDIDVLPFDANWDQKQTDEALKAAHDVFGRIDVVVNNAGYSQLGAVEETTDEEIHIQYETNVFGPLRVLRSALPFLRSQGSGTVIFLSSLGGLRSVAAGGIYCSTKFAIEGLAQALAEEVAPFNIATILVEPGYFRTNFLGDAGSGSCIGTRKKEYEGTVSHSALDMFQAYNGKQPGDPAKAGSRIWEAVHVKGLMEGKWNGKGLLRLPLGNDTGATLKDVATKYLKTYDDLEAVWSSTDL